MIGYGPCMMTKRIFMASKYQIRFPNMLILYKSRLALYLCTPRVIALSNHSIVILQHLVLNIRPYKLFARP